MAAWFAAVFFIQKSRLEEAIIFLSSVVELLPLLNSQSLERADQENFLSKFSGLASIACSVALDAGKGPSDALALLELRRDLLLGDSIDSKSDISRSGTADDELWQKFDKLRPEVETPLKTERDSFQSRSSKLRRRVEASSELNDTLAALRKLLSKENFQRTSSPKELEEMAREGPMVIVSTTGLRSNAIIVKGVGITTLKFPDLLRSHVNDRLLASKVLSNGYMKELLLCLWKDIIEPVLLELRFEHSTTTKDLPRVWWIAVGPTSHFPFHAAGDHSLESTRNILSRALSSYIPKFKALFYSREKQWMVSNQAKSRALSLIMASSPGQSPLPGAIQGNSSNEKQK